MAKEKPGSAKESKTAVLFGAVPEWANTTAIAQLLGKTVRRVQQLTQDGILPTEAPPGGGARKYRTCSTIQRYIAHIERKAHETGENGKQAELSLKKLEAEIALKESQGELHKLKTDIAKGKYIKAEKAESELADFMTVFHRFVDAMPTRMAGVMASYTDPATVRTMEKNMHKEFDALLSSFVDAAQTEEPPM